MFFEVSEPKIIENRDKKLKHCEKSETYLLNAWKPLILQKEDPF